MRLLVRGAASRKVAVILRIASYDGNDTYLHVGGDHIKEFVGPEPEVERVRGEEILDQLGLPPPGRDDGVMYAIITIDPETRSGGADYGYATPKEAMETVRRSDPGREIVTVD